MFLGGDSLSDPANGNAVIMTGGTVTNDVKGGNGQGANNNTVSISGGTVENSVYGGFDSHGAVGSTGNTVNISGGTINSAWLGRNYIAGGYAALAANNNTVNISGGTLYGTIVGGYASTGSAAEARNNTMTITGNPVFAVHSTKGGVSLMGGYSVNADNSTGNTLNAFTTGIRVAEVDYFQNFNFLIGAPNSVNVSATNINFSGGGDFNIGIVGVQGGSIHSAGTSITLLQSDNPFGGTVPAWNGQKLTAKQGISLDYEFEVAVGQTMVTAKVLSATVAPESTAGTTAGIVSMSQVNNGASLIANQGIDSARTATAKQSGLSSGSPTAAAYGLTPFFAVTGSTFQYNMDDATSNVNGAAAMVGLAKRWDMQSVSLMGGFFLDGSKGHFTASNNIGALDIFGYGNTTTLGGGIMGRLDVTEGMLKGAYTEASLRLGNVRSSYKSDSLRGSSNETLEYDTDNTYYGAHLGLGYVLTLGQASMLDLYGKYFWNHQTGNDVSIMGDTFNFDAVNSHRTRLGARYTYAGNDIIKPYVGAAWEHEFDGESRSTVYGLDVAAPSVKGSTGMMELGATLYTPADTNFSVDLNVQGYAGKREGVSGNVMMSYSF